MYTKNMKSITIKNNNKCVKELLDQGFSLLDIRDFFRYEGYVGLPLIGNDSSPLGPISLNCGPYELSYFDEDNEGYNFYSLKHMDKYTSANGDKRLPINGIITRDGKIYRADTLHMELAFWLKYNGVDLKNSLRYTYFVDSHRIEIRDGYDFVPVNNNNPDELYAVWSELHDENEDDWDLEPTEEQIQAIYHLKKSFENRFRTKIDFENIFKDNVGFRMDPKMAQSYTKEQRRVGDENDETINRALLKLFAKRNNPTWGE